MLIEQPTPSYRDAQGRLRSRSLRLLIVLATFLATILGFGWGFGVMRDPTTPRWLVTSIALLIGVLGIWLLFWLANTAVALLPSERWQQRLRAWVFVGPALALLLIYLVYPTLQTIYLSFMDARGDSFVGLDNYAFAVTDKTMRSAFVNNIYWLVGVTVFSVVLGLVIAVMLDRVRYEAFAKSLIFLPMVISFVGASVIWKFIYAYQPPGRPQIGLLNAVVTGLGGQPVGWLIDRQFNTFALIAIMIWLQTGFCMIILSAALKAIPGEIMDAARIDGAGELEVFFYIIIPALKTTIITVGTTVLIAVLKVFDIVYVMTNGQHNTEVIANRMYAEMFRFRNFGHGSALAVILLIAVLPVMIANVRAFRRQGQ